MGTIETMRNLDEKKFRQYSGNLLEGLNIFGSQITTTLALDTYAEMLSSSFKNNLKVFNATEGGLGIKGTKNISLREAINTYCTENISALKTKTLNSLPSKSLEIEKINKAAKIKLNYFRDFSNQLDELETEVKQSHPLSDSTKEHFVQKMRTTIQELLDNEEATLLLQGYDYSGFAIWNQKSNEIVKKKLAVETKNLLEEEFQRDQNFLNVLKNSVKFHLDVFSSLANEGN